MSPVIEISDTAEGQEALRACAEAVTAGALVVLPTDTVYGIGCDAFSPAAVARLLITKGRDRSMPLAVLVPQVDTLDGLAIEVPAYARQLAERFWPGPLTLILRAQPFLQWDLGESNGTVGLRMPDDEVALRLLAAVGPMAVSSANLTGAPTATSVLEAATMFGPGVEYYLDAGARNSGTPSTVVDCTAALPVVVRVGDISAAQVEAVVAAVAVSAEPGEAPRTDSSVDRADIAANPAAGDIRTPVGGALDVDTPGVHAEALELPTDEPAGAAEGESS